MNVTSPEAFTLLERKESSSISWLERSFRRLDVWLPVILGLVLVRLWLMLLPSSLWVDEMATAFVLRYGAHHASFQAAPQVPGSLYFWLPALAVKLFGFSEAALRLPSALALAGALYLIARITARLIDPAAGWFAVFVCLAFHGFDYEASNARPYALGTFLACASVWFLIRWLDSARRIDAALLIAAAALLCRVHLLFGPLYLLFGLYAAVRIARGDTCVRWRAAAAAFTILGFTSIPVAWEALALFREASRHVSAAAPTTTELIRSANFGLLSTLCAAGALLAWWRRWPRAEVVTSAGDLTLILGWWLGQPLALFAFSWLSRDSVFTARYLSVSLPGAGLVATLCAAAFTPNRHWKRLSLAMGISVVLFLGHWNRAWPAHQNSNWRGAAATFNAAGVPSDTPVICPSPFVEARPPVWRPGYPVESFLYSHLLVYRIAGKIYPFPFDRSADGDRYAAELSRTVLSRGRRFAIYGQAGEVQRWRDWFGQRPELAGWSSRGLGPFGDVGVVIFESGAISQKARL